MRDFFYKTRKRINDKDEIKKILKEDKNLIILMNSYRINSNY